MDIYGISITVHDLVATQPHDADREAKHAMHGTWLMTIKSQI